jgi:glycosyltransferase involved in cell wall biosynthesis
MVSIIVPVYNAERYIERCVMELAKSTYQDIEIVLVDDGSRDSSLKLCENMAEHDPRIKVITKDNGGVSSARNAGLDNAKGQYIMFCDNDDYYDRHAIEKYVDVMTNNDVDIVCSNFKVIGVDGVEKEGFSGNDLVDGRFDNREGMKNLLLNKGTSSNVWARMYKRKIFDSVRFPEGHAYEDADVSYRCFIEADNVFFLEESLYYWCRRENSEFTRKDEAARQDELRAAWNRYNDVYKKYDEELATIAFSELLFDYIHVYECYIVQGFELAVLAEDYSVIQRKNKMHKDACKYLPTRKKLEYWLLFKFPKIFVFVVKIGKKVRKL